MFNWHGLINGKASTYLRRFKAQNYSRPMDPCDPTGWDRENLADFTLFSEGTENCDFFIRIDIQTLITPLITPCNVISGQSIENISLLITYICLKNYYVTTPFWQHNVDNIILMSHTASKWRYVTLQYNVLISDICL